MFEKILIANRGEIALRIIRAARDLGIKTVAVYSTADVHCLHVKFADEAVCIGPPAARDSYLNVPALLAAAEITGADAIHPGYGFLSENAEFAEVCRSCGITFIGPTVENIRLLGNKVSARAAMTAAGLPILPGTKHALVDAADAVRAADEIGFPVILKAAAGGGGRGMKVVRNRAELERVFLTAVAEAQASFGNGEVYLERFIENPRHIEFQVIADKHGNIIHLGERECSVQRRHQKIIEECPSPAISMEKRMEIGALICKALKEVGYQSVGTVEFIMDEKGNLFFMEVNTRIQVEHPITEQVTGIDICALQIRLATGATLQFKQDDVSWRGHAFEYRINAEDPVTFAPSPGVITGYHEPGGVGVRVDGMAYTECQVLPNYDSLIAKLVCFGRDRDQALRRSRRALAEYVVAGIKTNIPFHRKALEHPDFISGRYDTRFVEHLLGEHPEGT
ncbi:MAG: acetyl-CoA carboxylase biotin carboxylase subunit [Myxococcota bacterium]